MSSCDPKALMDAARCFRCIPKGMLGEAMISLACEWANNAAPVATCTWYAGDGMSPPGDWTTYNSFADAVAAGTQSIIWGDLNAWWADDGSGTYVQFYELVGEWRAVVIMTGSNVPVFQGGPVNTIEEMVSIFLHNGFVPIGFCFNPGDCFWFAANGPDALALTNYNPYTSLADAEAAAIANGWPQPAYFWGSGNNYWLGSGPQAMVQVYLTGFGWYFVDIYDAAGINTYSNHGNTLLTLSDALADLQASGFLPPEYCTDNPNQQTIAIPDGSGGFWGLIVDTLGNVGAYAVSGPATPDIILADGSGGFWKVKVDNTGLRYTESNAGPATTAPVFMDTNGTFWTLVVDTLGNLGATS